MKKIVINTCWGGFGLSDAAIKRYAELKGLNLVQKIEDIGHMNYTTLYYLNEVDDKNYFTDHSIDRDDPFLVQLVEEMGNESNGGFSDLKVVEIPDDVEWEIDEYDGREHVAEKHRVWY